MSFFSRFARRVDRELTRRSESVPIALETLVKRPLFFSVLSVFFTKPFFIYKLIFL